MSQYRTNLVFRFNEQGRQKSGSTERKFERSDVSAVRRYQYSLNRYRQRIVESRPGEILIGGDLKAEGGEWRNSDSKILIGGTLSGLSKDKIANHATQEQRRLEEVGISEHRPSKEAMAAEAGIMSIGEVVMLTTTRASAPTILKTS